MDSWILLLFPGFGEVIYISACFCYVSFCRKGFHLCCLYGWDVVFLWTRNVCFWQIFTRVFTSKSGSIYCQDWLLCHLQLITARWVLQVCSGFWFFGHVVDWMTVKSKVAVACVSFWPEPVSFCSRYQTLAAATEAETKDKVEQKKISGKRLAVRKHTYYSGFVHPLDFF